MKSATALGLGCVLATAIVARGLADERREHADRTAIETPDELNIPVEFARITADHRLLSTSLVPELRAPLDRLTRRSYRMLILATQNRAEYSAIDRRTLAGMHELLGEPQQAIRHYRAAIDEHDSIEARAALVRALSQSDPLTAEKELETAAAKGSPRDMLAQAQRALALGFQRRNDWPKAVHYFDLFLKGPDAGEDDPIDARRLQSQREAAQRQRDRAARIVEMIGKPFPTEHRDAWLAGKDNEAVLAKADATLIDFFAIWMGPSRQRMEQIKALANQHPGRLAIAGVTRASGFIWNPVTGKGRFHKEPQLADESRGIRAYCEKNEIKYPTTLIERQLFDSYTSDYLPLTFVLDRAGVLRAVIGRDDDNQLKDAVEMVLGGE